VVHDWLKRLCGDAPFGKGNLVDTLLTSSKSPGKPSLCFYEYKQYPFMPVEFSVAAYRLGHSMVRGGYRINNIVPALRTFAISADNDDPAKPPTDFRGFRPLPAFWRRSTGAGSSTSRRSSCRAAPSRKPSRRTR
jgi:hypothetical protein